MKDVMETIQLTLHDGYCLSSADFFQDQLFRKILSGIPSEYQTVWIQIRPRHLPGLIWVQTVCKGCQQPTLVGKELMKFDYKNIIYIIYVHPPYIIFDIPLFFFQPKLSVVYFSFFSMESFFCVILIKSISFI